MRWTGYNAYYYENLPIDLLNPFDVAEKDGVKTGGMTAKKFLSLVDSIEKKGMVNPVMVEHGKRLTVAIGNNRVWAKKHLGHTHIKAVIFARESARPEGGELIPLKFLESRMEKIHPGDNTWIHCQAARWVRRAVRQETETSNTLI